MGINKLKFKTVKKVIWVICNYSGLRLLYYKINPPNGKEPFKKPSSFLLWFVGIYVALYSIASNRYESRFNLISNRVNVIMTQLSSPAYKQALNRIAEVQNMPCPTKPNILKPLITIRSLLVEEKYNEEISELLKQTIENYKDSLESVDLCGARLRDANLIKANLYNSLLINADLRGANLTLANLEYSYIHGAKLNDAVMLYVNLININKRKEFLLKDVNGGGYFTKKDIKLNSLIKNYSTDITVKQLSKVRTLYGSTLDVYIKNELMIERPGLFKSMIPRPPQGVSAKSE